MGKRVVEFLCGKLCVPLKVSERSRRAIDFDRRCRVFNPMQVRVLQTVRTQESSTLSYKVANLLQYYMLTMQRTIGDQSLLSQTLQE